MSTPSSHRSDEFPPGASDWPPEISRRDFLQLSAASLALAGLTACGRRGPKEIVARVAPPPFPLAAETESFATVMPVEGYGRGILVTTHDARPTKIEGNPGHPESLGATDVFTQAAILGLYDPDRSPAPRFSSAPATWTAFESALREMREQFIRRRGEGLVLLTEPTTSPTFRREVRRVLEAFPAARWFQHPALGRYDYGGADTDFDFARADVILAVQADCFYRHPAAVRYGRAFAGRRRIKKGQIRPPRFHALEPTPTVTGALADFRLPAEPARIRAVLDGIAQQLEAAAGSSLTGLESRENEFVRRFVDDARAHRGRTVCVTGPETDPEVRTWADIFNARFGAGALRRRGSIRSDAEARAPGDLAALAAALAAGEVDSLFIFGANPAYTAPGDLNFPQRLARSRRVVHMGEYPDETAACAHWHLPESHFLESWSDLRGYDGTASIQQPIIAPLHDSRSALEILHLLATGVPASAYNLVRETWRGDSSPGDFEASWHGWLRRGVVAEASPPDASPPAVAHDFPALVSPATANGITAIFLPDPNVLDGRFANHPWLQELPKPLTHLVWENAGLVSPALAAREHLANGDLIACEIGSARVVAPVWIQPGQADNTVALSLGYGRTRAGRVGNRLGYDAYPLRHSTTPWTRPGVVLRKLGQAHALVSTQAHFAMEGREPVRLVSPGTAARVTAEPPPATSLYPPWPTDRYAWGMAIDLGACLGCNACIIACQAENNIPSVGREQVARGREMHWLRVDRYLAGEPENPRFLAQPVPCMHCENAPCELVCPVGATVHSSEGLNDMVYNRCIGTRYCSNNCPYKVRRFNFLEYRPPAASPLLAQANPTVTIRERGVMEKCTYCVQRINAARITADRQNRLIRDGEVRTACQQVCPAEAITFGNLNDPVSDVSQRKAEPTNYALLAGLNTRPRTTYLAAIRHEAVS